MLIFKIHAKLVSAQSRYPSTERFQGCLDYQKKARIDANAYQATGSDPTSVKRESSQ